MEIENEDEEETLDDEESQEDKTEDEKSENESKDEKPKRSGQAQKEHWRNKAKQSSAKVQQLETELARLRDAVKKPDDEKEAAAQEYIRNQARAVYEELQLAKAKEKAKEDAAFEERIEEILADNPDIAEEELLETIDEYEVEPKTALKILQRQSKETKEKKPKMPTARRATPGNERDSKPADDSNKSMWQILKEEKERLKK